MSEIITDRYGDRLKFELEYKGIKIYSYGYGAFQAPELNLRGFAYIGNLKRQISAELTRRKKRKGGSNPGARWHDLKALEYKHKQKDPRADRLAASYFGGQHEAHKHSAEVSRLRGMNPRRGRRKDGGPPDPLTLRRFVDLQGRTPEGSTGYVHALGHLIDRTWEVSSASHVGRFWPAVYHAGEDVWVQVGPGAQYDKGEIVECFHFGHGGGKTRYAAPFKNPLTKKEQMQIDVVRWADVDKAQQADRRGDTTQAYYYEGKYTRAREILRDYSKPTYKRNPAAPVEIYERIVEIKANKGRKSNYAGQGFVHKFTRPARILGMPDGSLKVVGHKGQRLWGNFNA